MSFEKAQQFVARMREDKSFRRGIQDAREAAALKEQIQGAGYLFSEQELMMAMAACMDNMEEPVQ